MEESKMKHSKRRREYEMWRAEYHKMREAMRGCPEHGVIYDRFRSRMVYAESKMDELMRVPGVAVPIEKQRDPL
jgi:hypothetical protein